MWKKIYGISTLRPHYVSWQTSSMDKKMVDEWCKTQGIDAPSLFQAARTEPGAESEVPAKRENSILRLVKREILSSIRLVSFWVIWILWDVGRTAEYQSVIAVPQERMVFLCAQ